MQAYTGFAQVYDIFMDNVPYDLWVDYLTGLLAEYGVKSGLVLELGCGTGSITRRLAEKGYDMIGIDNSEEMLEIARFKEYELMDTMADFSESESVEDKGSIKSEKQEPNERNILYLQQDMRNFELYGTVAAVVSICDSINYITIEEDLEKVFRLVNNYLDPGGIFIFDMNTEYKYKDILGDTTIAENREDCSFIWDNCYYEDKKINEYDVTIFVKVNEDSNDMYDGDSDCDLLEEEQEEDYQEEQDGQDEREERDTLESGEDDSQDLYERFHEIHYQKAYTIETVKKLLEAAGMEFMAVYDAFTHNPPTEKSERVYFIAREKYQENKKYIIREE